MVGLFHQSSKQEKSITVRLSVGYISYIKQLVSTLLATEVPNIFYLKAVGTKITYSVTQQRRCFVTSRIRSKCNFGGKLSTDDRRLSSTQTRRYGNNSVSSSLAR